MSLRWKDIDFNRQVIILQETKNGDRWVLPLAGHALELVKQLSKIRHVNCDFVFPGNDFKKSVDLRTPFENALKRAEIADFRWHDLRHSCASYLAMNGASLAEIAEILGHKTLQMVKRYAHLSEAHTSTLYFYNHRVMHNPVYSGDCHDFIGKQITPVTEGLICRYEQAAIFVPMSNQLKEDRGFLI